jgi:hypothetical protein
VTPHGRSDLDGRRRLAEADGNRTRLTELLGHNGFEDRARHQTRNASIATLELAAGTRRRPAPVTTGCVRRPLGLRY